MSKDLNIVEEFVIEVLLDLMNERVMSERGLSIGVHASSTRTVQASLSTCHKARPSRPLDEKKTKHMDDLTNAKLIPTILPTYIPPLSDAVN
jgi:hypothetical protein